MAAKFPFPYPAATMIKCAALRSRITIVVLVLLASLLYLVTTTFLLRRPDPLALPQRVAPIQLVRETITTASCHPDVFMVVLVGSHPDHRDVRDVIRRTWGDPKLAEYPFKLVFLFGQSDQSSVRQALADESASYGDVIQGDFDDSYHNITARDLMGLRWVARHCSDARFVMRADDDIALDIYTLLDVLQQRRFNDRDHPDFLACFIVTRNASVERTGRYGLSRLDFPADVYPDFCHGWAYILTPRLARRLVLASSTLLPPFWINDVYITGSLIRALDMRVVDLEVTYSLAWNLPSEVAAGRSVGCADDGPFVLLPTKAQAWLTDSLQRLYSERARTLRLPRHEFPVRRSASNTNCTLEE